MLVHIHLEFQDLTSKEECIFGFQFYFSLNVSDAILIILYSPNVCGRTLQKNIYFYKLYLYLYFIIFQMLIYRQFGFIIVMMFLPMFRCFLVLAIFRAPSGVIACMGIQYRQDALLNKTSNPLSDLISGCFNNCFMHYKDASKQAEKFGY
jgi:hypothetical protein